MLTFARVRMQKFKIYIGVIIARIQASRDSRVATEPVYSMLNLTMLRLILSADRCKDEIESTTTNPATDMLSYVTAMVLVDLVVRRWSPTQRDTRTRAPSSLDTVDVRVIPNDVITGSGASVRTRLRVRSPHVLYLGDND
jgi:hypothetical protein